MCFTQDTRVSDWWEWKLQWPFSNSLGVNGFFFSLSLDMIIALFHSNFSLIFLCNFLFICIFFFQFLNLFFFDDSLFCLIMLYLTSLCQGEFFNFLNISTKSNQMFILNYLCFDASFKLFAPSNVFSSV